MARHRKYPVALTDDEVHRVEARRRVCRAKKMERIVTDDMS